MRRERAQYKYSHLLTFLGMEEDKSWVFLPILIRNYPLKKVLNKYFDFFFQGKLGERRKSITGKTTTCCLLSERWGTKGRQLKRETILLFLISSWNRNVEATFRNMENFQTNRQRKTNAQKWLLLKMQVLARHGGSGL